MLFLERALLPLSFDQTAPALIKTRLVEHTNNTIGNELLLLLDPPAEIAAWECKRMAWVNLYHVRVSSKNYKKTIFIIEFKNKEQNRLNKFKTSPLTYSKK